MSRFDGIGRPVQTRTDSELGALNRRYSYRPGFITRVTNEGGKFTDFSYLAFDSPSTDQPIEINAPGKDAAERIVTSIARDIYGKPLTIARGQGSNLVERRFVYDAHQRLCRSFDPEALWTVQTYDAANNINWRAMGQAMTNAPANQCADHLVSHKQHSIYTFDSRNRLEHINHPDGTHDLHFDYYPDGALAGTIVYNDVGTALTSWSYTYNSRRLLETETLSVAGRNYLLQHNYDRYGSRSQLIYPDGTQLSYAPNRLGQPKAVGALANTVKYQPSGAVMSFNYGNNVSYLATPNVRQLPLTVQISNGILNEEYTWDQVGNLRGVSDNRSPLTSASRTRSFDYDHANRLTDALYAAPGLGPYGYEYDIHDNITLAERPAILGGNRHYEYSESTRRLDRLHNDNDQTQIAYLYDAQGNATLRDPSGLGMDAYAYHYDRANRLIEVRDPLDQTKIEASYLYDGHARRVQITEGGELRTQLYSQAGQYLFEEPDLITDASFTVSQSKQGKPSTRYQYLGNMLIAKSSGTQTTYLHTDHLGSPIAESSVGPTVEVTHLPLHEPYGAPSNGTYLDGPGYTGHVVDGLTGLSYMQARYYDPVAGRFLGVDPVHVNLGTGGNFGRYWYANNNPYRFLDPDGLWACETSSRHCDNFRESLARAAEIAQSDRLSTGEQEQLQRAVDFYGEEGNTDVLISFSEVGNNASTEVRDDGGVVVTFSVIRADSPKDVLARSVSHEGEHGANLVARGGYPSSRAERVVDEIKAKVTGGLFEKGANLVDFGSGASWTPLGGLNLDKIRTDAEAEVNSICKGSQHESCK